MTTPPDHPDDANDLEGDVDPTSPRREDEPDEIGFSSVNPDDPPLTGMPVEEVEADIDSVGTIRSGRLAGMSLTRAIVTLAIPVLLQQTMQASVGMFDKVIAGNLPDDIVVPALDGLGIGSYIGWFIGICMAGLGIGGQAIIARAMGAGNAAESHRALGQAIAMSAVWGVAVGIILWLIAPPLTAMCKLNDEAAQYCIDYIRILSYSMPACGVMLVGSMSLHGAGETLRPSIIAVTVNIANIIFSWMFSGADIRMGEDRLINPFGFDMHVDGIALGTALSYLIGGAWTLLVLFRGVNDLRLRPAEMKLDVVMMRRFIRIGIPNFAEGMSMWMVNLFILTFIGIIATGTESGEGLQGAHIIAVQWESFSFMPGFAIGTAAAALAGQFLGAGNPRMARKAVMVCTGIAIVVMTLLGAVFAIWGEWLTSLVSNQEVHLTHTPRLLFICGVTQTFFAITMVVRQGLRGVGDTKWTFLITTVSSYGVRMPAAYLLGVVLGYGIEGIWIGLCGEFVVRACLFSARFFHGGWMRIEV